MDPGVTDRFADTRAILQQERRRVTDEREAFEVLHNRIEEIDTDGATTTTARHRTLVAGPVATSTRAVRDAYVATVMSVPHYDAEYGEPYRENVRIELGPEVAAAIDSGFEPRTKRATLTAIEEAHAERVRFVDALDAEAESLSVSERRVKEVREEVAELTAEAEAADGYGTLDAIRTRLGVLEDHCDEAAQERQAAVELNHEAIGFPDDCPDIQQYLYAELDESYPALATVAEVSAAVRRTRRRVCRQLMTFD